MVSYVSDCFHSSSSANISSISTGLGDIGSLFASSPLKPRQDSLLHESYKNLTGTAWTLVYFVSFYLITVLLLLNLVVAFVLEAFFAEMDLESCEKSSDGEAQDDKGNQRRRNIGIKSRNQRVDNLLHHMLSAELQAECSTS